MAVVTMRQLLEAGVHFGHQTRRWNPKMKRFILGERNGIYLIDLRKTLSGVESAYSFVRDLVADGGTVLFVGTKKQTQGPVAEYAEACGMPYVNQRWLGGMLTNFTTVSGRVKRMQELRAMQAAGDFDGMPKREALQHTRELEKLSPQPGRHRRPRPPARTRCSSSTRRRSTSPSPRRASSASRWWPSSTPTATPTSSTT